MLEKKLTWHGRNHVNARGIVGLVPLDFCLGMESWNHSKYSLLPHVHCTSRISAA